MRRAILGNFGAQRVKGFKFWISVELYGCGERLLEAGNRTKDSIYVYMGYTRINTLALWYIIKGLISNPEKKIPMTVPPC